MEHYRISGGKNSKSATLGCSASKSHDFVTQFVISYQVDPVNLSDFRINGANAGVSPALVSSRLASSVDRRLQRRCVLGQHVAPRNCSRPFKPSRTGTMFLMRRCNLRFYLDGDWRKDHVTDATQPGNTPWGCGTGRDRHRMGQRPADRADPAPYRRYSLSGTFACPYSGPGIGAIRRGSISIQTSRPMSCKSVGGVLTRSLVSDSPARTTYSQYSPK